MGAMASQITSLTIVYSTVYSGADQRKHQSSASLAFVQLGNSPGTDEFPAQMASNAEMCPFADVIMDQKMCATHDVYKRKHQAEPPGIIKAVFHRAKFGLRNSIPSVNLMSTACSGHCRLSLGVPFISPNMETQGLCF